MARLLTLTTATEEVRVPESRILKATSISGGSRISYIGSSRLTEVFTNTTSSLLSASESLINLTQEGETILLRADLIVKVYENEDGAGTKVLYTGSTQGYEIVEDTVQSVQDKINATTDFTGDVSGGEFVFVDSKDKLPAPVNGVITLKAETTYYFTGHVDLEGDRIVASANTVILGSSSENCSLTSTGIGSDFLVSTEYTIPIRHITFKDVTNAIDINSGNTGVQPIAIDWYGVNFSGCDVNILCGDVDNFIFNVGAVLGQGKISFTGEIGTIGINQSLFVGDGSATPLIELTSTSTITRRFRITYSAFVAFTDTTAIDVDATATVPVEGFILDTCNFSGGGTYLPGVDSTSNKALFSTNVGIENSADISQYFMSGNATATTISSTGVAVKIAGTTTSAAITSKFTNTDNRATYVGALIKPFKVTATLSVESGNNNQIGVYVAKNGTLITQSEVYGTTSGAGRAENIVVQTFVDLQQNDYLELWVENDTSTQDVVVTDLNFIVD